MTSFLKTLVPEDIMALLFVVGFFTLRLMGRTDPIIDHMMNSVVTYRMGAHAGQKAKAGLSKAQGG